MIGLLPTTTIFLATAAVCMSFVIAEGTGSKSSSGKRVDTGYAPGGLSKGLFGGRKGKEPARATDGRNSCCCWEASILSKPKTGSGIGEKLKRNSFSAGL